MACNSVTTDLTTIDQPAESTDTKTSLLSTSAAVAHVAPIGCNTKTIERLWHAPLRVPLISLFEKWPAEDPEITRTIWPKLFRLEEQDLMALYFFDHSRMWQILGIEKPDWWTGDFVDGRHDLYQRPITRFVDTAYRERALLKWLKTRRQRECTESEFDTKWRNGDYYPDDQWA